MSAPEIGTYVTDGKRLARFEGSGASGEWIVEDAFDGLLSFIEAKALVAWRVVERTEDADGAS